MGLLQWLTALAAVTAVTNAVDADAVFHPTSFTLNELKDSATWKSASAAARLHAALATDGVVVISDISTTFGASRRAALLGAHVCGKHAPKAKTITFDDGTSRTTLAAVTSGFSELHPLQLGSLPADDEVATAACSPQFEAAIADFRSTVSEVASAFVKRVDEVFPTFGAPLLLDNVDLTKTYDNVTAIARHARHLEHFHSYHLPVASHPAPAEGKSTLSIDLHADQGMFIAFTPAMLVEDAPDGSTIVEGADAGTFYVQRGDGSAARTEFGFNDDVIVLLLGDGVDQYVNPRLPGEALRAAPHAMAMPEHSAAQSRVWYGRMFLPPDDALSETHGLSFARVREVMIDAVSRGDGVGSGVGCSRKLLESEQLECADDQIYCWMRCMDFTEQVSPDACAEQGLGLQCLSQRQEVWAPADSHGDYNPECTNATLETAPVTDPPPIPARPMSCDAADFVAFAGDADYGHKLVLTSDDKLVLLWEVREGVMHAKLAYNGRAGYMALGVENVGGFHNGMCGSHIIMGIHDPDPEIFGAPFVGTGVQEYVIDDSLTAFRHWKDPAPTQSAVSASIDAGVTAADQDDCFTSVTFETAAIAGVPLNLTAGQGNRLIFAVHSDSFLKGYHGYMNRGHLHVDLAAGELIPEPQPSPPPQVNESVARAAVTTPPSAATAVPTRAATALAAMAAALFLLV